MPEGMDWGTSLEPGELLVWTGKVRVRTVGVPELKSAPMVSTTVARKRSQK